MRAFYNCMEYEEALQPNYHYFTGVQENITPFHREQAIDWIYDVAKEENCDGDVFLLAVSLIDRFMSVQNILKHDIQVSILSMFGISPLVLEVHKLILLPLLPSYQHLWNQTRSDDRRSRAVYRQ